jgi:glutaredoxin
MPESTAVKRVNSNLAVACLVLAAAISGLIFADRWTDLSIGFPPVWYRSRNFHVLIAVGLYLASWLAFRSAKSTSVCNDATRPVFESVRFFTRKSCGLCDEALLVLAEFADRLPDIEQIDIDEHPEHLKRHSEFVPVVEIDGNVRFRGHVNRVLLQRLIDAAVQQQLAKIVSEKSVPDDLKEEGQGG